jgi:hypothetical protein
MTTAYDLLQDLDVRVRENAERVIDAFVEEQGYIDAFSVQQLRFRGAPEESVRRAQSLSRPDPKVI